MLRLRRRPSGLLALVTALAVLVQGMVVVACDLHDAVHAAEAAVHGHAIDDHDQHPEQSDDGWHALFHAGHHCHHVPVPAFDAVVHWVLPPSTGHVIAAACGPPDAPSGLLLRPPIQA